MFSEAELSRTPVALAMTVGGVLATVLVHETLGWRIWICALAGGVPAALAAFGALWVLSGWYERFRYAREQKKKPPLTYD